MSDSHSPLHQALASVKYPGFSRDIVSFGLVQSAEIIDGRAIVKIAIKTADVTIPKQIKDEVERAVLAVDGVNDALVQVAVTSAQAPTESTPTGPAPMPGVRYTVAIASGKGGVGKSTFAVNLACALSRLIDPDRSGPSRVGIMDCDIYGPSVPLMMGLQARPEIEGESLLPLERHGVKVMSMGFLVDADTPVIWRGPMVMKTIQQFVQNVKWGDLDVLVVDLPPGTGDAQLSLVQTIPLTGAVLVTTPQIAATQVARRGGLMFEKVNVPVLGVAENMSFLEMPDGSKNFIFGQGGGLQTAESLGVPLLGQVPLFSEVREAGDRGEPLVASAPESPAAGVFSEIAGTLMNALNATI